jgi:hypothetical protein
MPFKDGYALIIGVGSYTHVPSANIPISVTDALAVSEVLQNPALCGYPPDQVSVLHNGEASRERILTELDTLAAKTTAGTTVLFYYCGHGEYGTDGNYYLTTYDTRASQGRVVQGTGIREAELIDKLRSIPAKRVLLLFNACHSGEISPSLSFDEEEKSFGDINPPPNATDALLSTGEGRIIITASRPEQKSWVGKGKLSIYTQALLDGLSGRGYVSNNKGYVSVFSLYESMYLSIKKAAKTLGKTQEPELTVLRGVGPFPVSLYQGATPLGSFAPEESLPADTATREISTTRSQRLFQYYISIVEASGDRSVAIGGDVSESTIITGDQHKINTGGGAYIEGKVDTGGGDFVGRDQHKSTGLNAEQVARLFERINIEIDAKEMSETDKQDLKADINELKVEAEKGDQADDSFLMRRLRNIRRMAPDILEVVLAALTNPAAGFTLSVQKIARKMRAEGG